MSPASLRPTTTAASSAQPDFPPAGALDGDRFSAAPGQTWKGVPGEAAGWWEARFDPPQEVGAILQVNGDEPDRLWNAPRRSIWQWSADGRSWENLEETRIAHERRAYRLHRLRQPVRATALRLSIADVVGGFAALREVEFYPTPDAAVPFDDWVIVVSTVEEDRWPAPGDGFVTLARACPGWEHLQFQQIWLDAFDEAFIAAEPHPLCAFLTGNFKDWCQVPREPWRGAQEVLANRNLPIWAACGGAQGLAILSETGVDQEWDCPHCRDPRKPRLPIYGHIGHTGERPCGDYSACLYERGRFHVRQTHRDPAFVGLPQEFAIMESHCGQIEWPPEGWTRIITAGSDAHTPTQCIRVRDRYIYAAQFHMEMEGTPENSRRIMGNFLALAKRWGGYNPNGEAVPLPAEW
jgi:hypothetical protein